VSTESSSVTWLSAHDAVAAVEAEELLMLPPTYLTCLEIGQFGTPAEVLAAAVDRTVEMFMPELVDESGDATLSMPEELRSLVESRFG
jgi:hypothetical protein